MHRHDQPIKPQLHTQLKDVRVTAFIFHLLKKNLKYIFKLLQKVKH